MFGNRYVLSEDMKRQVNLQEATGFIDFERGGIVPLKSGKIKMQPNTVYFMGASSSPDRIIVTKVQDKWIYYLNYPYRKEHKIDRSIGEDLIYRGVTTWLKSHSSYSDDTNTPNLMDQIKSLKNMLDGKDGDKIDPREEQYVEITVSVSPKYKGVDFWRALEEYGSVGMKDDKYIVRMQRGNVVDLEQDDRFKIEGTREGD